MMSAPQVSAFFVYGTLKRSFLRGGLWPKKPLRIVAGTIQSDLFDLGPYPAAAPGMHWLLGEIWEFQPEDMEQTIRELDLIEGYDPHRVGNEYIRQVVSAEFAGQDSVPSTILAYAYFAAEPKQIEIARPIKPFLQFMGRPVAAWPDSIARVPVSFSEE
jgi:gamma-glutamylcyclotransferase (GGCT)/AIG2-like uncharacterized protein YtfP